MDPRLREDDGKEDRHPRACGNPGAPEGMDPRDKPEDDAMRPEDDDGRVYYEFKGF